VVMIHVFIDDLRHLTEREVGSQYTHDVAFLIFQRLAVGGNSCINSVIKKGGLICLHYFLILLLHLQVVVNTA
jgi:hypothetical protein